jgi:hypothetical protein
VANRAIAQSHRAKRVFATNKHLARLMACARQIGIGAIQNFGVVSRGGHGRRRAPIGRTPLIDSS